jgi:hypothetical protein
MSFGKDELLRLLNIQKDWVYCEGKWYHVLEDSGLIWCNGEWIDNDWTSDDKLKEQKLWVPIDNRFEILDL